jgi:hypothetical protein
MHKEASPERREETVVPACAVQTTGGKCKQDLIVMAGARVVDRFRDGFETLEGSEWSSGVQIWRVLREI